MFPLKAAHQLLRDSLEDLHGMVHFFMGNFLVCSKTTGKQTLQHFNRVLNIPGCNRSFCRDTRSAVTVWED